MLRRNQQGMTLIELVIAIVIISISIAGVMQVYSEAIRGSTDPLIRQQAVAIAEAYLEEILLQPFCDSSQNCQPGNAPGTAACAVCPNAEAQRNLFDNVCDYNGLNDNNGPIRQDGQPFASGSGMSAYNVAVSINSSVTLSGLSGNQCQLLQATITVTHDHVAGLNYRLVGLRSNIGGLLP